MSEISLGQFIKSAFDYSTGKPPQNQQAVNVQNEKFQEVQRTAAKIVQDTVQNIQRNFIQQSSILNTQMQLKQLTAMERTAMLKELFNFPQELQEFLKQVITENKTILTQKELTLLMSKELDLTKLIVLFQQNGKGAVEKIAKLIATMNQSGIYNTQQLKDLSNIINASISVNESNPTQVIKTIMLMYLPWLPLTENTGFNIGFEEGEEKKGKDSDDTVTIFITTKNYGLVKIFLFKEDQNLNIELNTNESFPKEDFKSAVNTPGTQITCITRKSHDDENTTESKITFSGTGKISPLILMTVHKLVKVVLEIDMKAELRKSRKNTDGSL